MRILIVFCYLTSALSFTVPNPMRTPYRTPYTCTWARPKSAYSGVGARVAKKVKRQYRLENYDQVRSLRRALKKYKRMEEKDAIKASMNTLKSQHSNLQKAQAAAAQANK